MFKKDLPVKRVVIAGCRDFEDYKVAKEYIDFCLSNIRKENEIIIVSGGAKGADSLGERYAKENGFETLIVDTLVNCNGYEQGVTTEYNKQYAIDEDRLFRFLLSTQKKAMDELHILDSFDSIGQIGFVPGAAYIVCSFSHKTDGDILNVILSKEPSYVGMLGGKPKIRALFTKLKENGYSEDVLKQIHAPIGLDIGGEKPAEIAVSIMAEILASRCGGTCRPMRDILRDSIFPL